MILALLLLATPDLSGMLRLTSAQGLAHGCPIKMDLALTNAHVATVGQMVWGVDDGELAHGLIEPGESLSYRDLAWIRPATAARFPAWYRISEKAPKIGDRIWFLGYDWSNEKTAFGPKTLKGTITRLFNGQIAFDNEGQPGSSGSCILNEAGEVVAINEGSKQLDNQTLSGVGVGVWGDWLNLRPDAKPEPEPQPYWEVSE